MRVTLEEWRVLARVMKRERIDVRTEVWKRALRLYDVASRERRRGRVLVALDPKTREYEELEEDDA